MPRRGYGPAARWQPEEVDSRESPPPDHTSPPGAEAPLEGMLEFVLVSPLTQLPVVGDQERTIAELKQVGTPVAWLRRPRKSLALWLGKPELHFATSRLRLADPPGTGWLEKIRRDSRLPGRMPRRQRVWRTAAGNTATRIEETSLDRKSLSGLFRFGEVDYQMNGQKVDWLNRFDYTLRDQREPVATFRPKTGFGLETGWFVEVHRPRPLGAIAVACHMATWLAEAVSSAGGGAGGAGGGGGDGGGC